MSAAILVAAGRGERLGADRPKALVEVAGVPLVRAACQGLIGAGIGRIVIAAPPAHVDDVGAVVADLAADVLVVPGGPTRTESVTFALAALVGSGPLPSLVVVHDAARGFAPPEMIRRAMEAVADDVVAAAPGLAITDTIKRTDAAGSVVETVDRTNLVGIQTPQAFRTGVLQQAHASGMTATDDLALVESLLEAGVIVGRVAVTPGSPLATKVTHPDDVTLLECLLGRVT